MTKQKEKGKQTKEGKSEKLMGKVRILIALSEGVKEGAQKKIRQ